MITFNTTHKYSTEDDGRIYFNKQALSHVYFNGKEVYTHRRWRTVFEGSQTVDLTSVLAKYTSGTDFTDHTDTIHASFPSIRASKPIRISYTARFVEWSGYFRPDMDTWRNDPDQTGDSVDCPITFYYTYADGNYYKDPVGQIDIPTQDGVLDIFVRCIAQGSKNWGMWYNSRSYMSEIIITKIEQFF